MENVITEVSKYLIILLMMIYTFSCFTVFRKRDIEDQKNVLRRQIVLMLFMNLVAYTVLFLQDNDMKMLMMYGAVFLFIVVVQILYRVIYRKGNKTYLTFEGGDNTIREARSPHLRGKKLLVAESNESNEVVFDTTKVFINK